MLQTKKNITNIFKPTFRIININSLKYLKRTEFKDNTLAEIHWTKNIDEAMLLGDLVIALVMNYLRKEKKFRVTFESTKLSKYALARKAHIEHVEKSVKRIIREKNQLAKLIDAKSKMKMIGKNEPITPSLIKAINDL